MVASLRYSALLATVVVAVSLNAAAQKPQVGDLLKIAGEYLVEYAQKLSAAAAQEDYVQREPAVNAHRRLQSELVLLGLDDGAVALFRDVYAMDGHQLRPRDGRLLALLTPTSQAALDRARGISDEGTKHYVSSNLRAMDSPVLALEFLRSANQAQSEFSIENVRTQDGAQVAQVRFTVKPGSTIMPVPEGATTSGKFWIDTATGAVRQTELTVGSKHLMFKQGVKYASDPALGLWVPAEMIQQCDLSTSGTGGFSNMGAGGGMGAKQSLEGRARYSNWRR